MSDEVRNVVTATVNQEKIETSDTEEDKQSIDEHILEDLDSIGMANNIKKYKELEA